MMLKKGIINYIKHEIMNNLYSLDTDEFISNRKKLNKNLKKQYLIIYKIYMFSLVIKLKFYS